MSYSAEISRNKPTAFLFVIDQSGSMGDPYPDGKSKADFLSDVLNRTLYNLITRCTKAEGTRDYFEVGVISYSSDGINNGFKGNLANNIINKISLVEANPLRVEDRKKKIPDGAGGLVEQNIKFPVWFDSRAYGGTPMCAALTKAAEEIIAWCDAHPDCYPPTILHITDGESGDGNPEEIADQIKLISTNDGNVLLFNLHLSVDATEAIRFPSVEDNLPNDYAKMLFRMSSVLPDHLLRFAKEKGIKVSSEASGFIFNAEAVDIVDFFDIGTRASQLR